MSTINGKSFSSPKNINLKEGIVRFNDTFSSNPIDSSSNGIYVNASNQLIFSAQGTSTTLGATGGSGSIPSLDAIFQGDQTLDLGALSTLTIDRSSGNNDVLTITNTGAGSGDCIQITNVGTGNDIEGTSDTWHFSKAGDMTANKAVFSGDAGSNSLTLTAGDVVFSDGSVTITDADDAASFTLTNNTATSASVVVIAGSGVFTGSTTTSFMTITPSGLTTGTAVYLPLAALTTGVGLQIVGNAITTGKLLNITSSAGGTQLTGAGRLLYIQHSGTATGTGTLAEITSAAADETVIAKFTASSTLALGSIVSVSGSSMTTGNAINIADLDSLTTGTGITIASAATAITGAGRMLYVNHTGATSTSGTLVEFATAATDETVVCKITTAAMVNGVALSIVGTTGMTSGSLIRATTSTAGAVATNGIYSFKSTGAFTSTSNCGLVDIGASATVAGTVVHITSSAAGQTTSELLNVTASGYTTGYTGNVVNITGVSTTGASNVLLVTGANTTAGNTVKIDAAAVTTGTGLLVTSAGVIITTGELVSLVANGATTCTGVLRASATALTDGWMAEFTGGGANFTASGGMLNLAMGAATVGTGINITTSGVYTGTTGVIDLNAASATTGILMDINGAGLTSGTAIKINATEATLTTGKYIDCYDGAASDFTVAKYGATTIAGNASGTAALTVTAGDIVITSGFLVVSANAKGITFTGTGSNGGVLKNLKNAAASGLSGTQKDIEIDIGGTPYYFTVYPTKA